MTAKIETFAEAIRKGDDAEVVLRIFREQVIRDTVSDITRVERASRVRFKGNVPIAVDSVAVIDVPSPMTEAEWSKLLELLSLYKAALVEPESAE